MGQETVTPQGLGPLFRALAGERVAYGVFGAIAMALHGLPRATADVDLFVKATPDNVERLKRDTVRPGDRLDAALLAQRFGFVVEEP